MKGAWINLEVPELRQGRVSEPQLGEGTQQSLLSIAESSKYIFTHRHDICHMHHMQRMCKIIGPRVIFFILKVLFEQFMTKNRLMVTIHSKDVTEILALYRRSEIDFPPHFLVRLMHSFPMMYNTI